MEVITLDETEFDKVCAQLAEKISNKCVPMVLIGIASGGAIVASHVQRSLLNNDPHLKYFEISASRESTKTKRNFNLQYLLKRLPLRVLNYLRVSEYLFLKQKMKRNRWFERNVFCSDELKLYLKGKSSGCVCIVDDAIDSGSTIASALNLFKNINSSLDYKVASLVVTQENPLVSPDVFLYSNVLIRFPWSNDFKTP